ncbi:MAG TPA: TonB-dependent receptor plug domain-containing protein [Anditalea sp.]|nr:TonB-dependent receptor plug domain-containing protein [Anditalea sp.]
MKHTRIKYIFGLIAGILMMSAFIGPKNDIIDTIKTSLNTYKVNYAPEKIYVHHDKPYYMAGEVLWLKAYVLDAVSRQATTKSGVIYVDLYSDQDELVERLTLPIANGEAIGDINLPDDLTEGIYRLSAFTHYMRNFGEDIFFQKEIFILSNNEALGHSGATSDPVFDLQFFPEGGELVSGLQNTVAFKAVDGNGKGVPISASLFDDKGKKILEFSDGHAGMGSFAFTPDVNSTYFAKLNFKDGQTIDYPLPKAISEGYVLHVDEVNDPDNIAIEIKSNKGDGGLLRLFAITDQNLLYNEEFQTPSEGSFETSIPKNLFPTGITRFTLTKEDGEPLAERLVFIKHPDSVDININTDKNEYERREEVNLSLDLAGEEKLARLSMSVTAEDLVVQPTQNENIKSYLLLSSDLKGYIESPGYYFEGDDTERQNALRHLMMTQGWRKFGWNQMLAKEFPSIQYSNELDLNIRGRLINRKGEPISNGEALLFLKDRNQTFITTETNKDGYFTFRGFYFTGSVQVVIQGSDQRGRTEGVEVQILEKGPFPLIAENRVRLPKDFSSQLPEDYVVNTLRQFEGVGTAMGDMDLRELLLEEIVVEGRAKVFEPFKLHEQADAILYRESLPVSPSGNIMESLQGRVAGLNITRSGMNEFRAVIRGQGTPLYLLDGMPISEESMQMINQFDIKRIEILKRPGSTAIYGGRASGGVIALFTDQGYEEIVDTESGKHITVERISGFNTRREFYTPSIDSALYNDMPDLRSTIYWNPSITVEKSASVTFPTADTPGNYRIIIEGITEDGKPIFKETTFVVR